MSETPAYHDGTRPTKEVISMCRNCGVVYARLVYEEGIRMLGVWVEDVWVYRCMECLAVVAWPPKQSNKRNSAALHRIILIQDGVPDGEEDDDE